MTTLDDECYRHMCHCGHHRDTHFNKKEACLGLGCDGVCKAYRDDQKPDPGSSTARRALLQGIISEALKSWV